MQKRSLKNSSNHFFAVLVAGLTITTVLASPFSFAGEELRLIQTSETQRQWMKPSEIHALAEKNHEEGRCGGFMDVTDHQDAKPFFSASALKALAPRSVQHQRLVTPLLAQMKSANMLATVTKLSGMHSRYSKNPTAIEAARWLRDQFTAMAQGRSDITVEFKDHQGFQMPSVVARIAGSSNTLARETVVLGGHADSIHLKRGLLGPMPVPNGHAPGADDNASGIAALMEAFRVVVQSGYRPQRTIEFMAYAGEELGLLGSQDIANSYARASREVVAVLQLDMVAYAGRSKTINFISDHVNTPLTQFTMKLVDEYVRMPYSSSTCGYACSDHASWSKAGYPSVFPTEAPLREANRLIHTDRDTIANDLDMEYGLHFSKLAAAFAVELSRD